MKKTLISLAAFIGTFTFVNAQQENYESVFESSNIIKIAPLGLFFNNYQVSYESIYKPNRSFEILLAYDYMDDLSIIDLRNDRLFEPAVQHEIGIWSNYRFYTPKKPIAGKGFYYGPSASYIFTNTHSKSNDYNFSTIGVGGIAGYQFFLGKNKKRITLDFNITTQYQFSVNNKGNTSHQLYLPIGIKLGCRYKKKVG